MNLKELIEKRAQLNKTIVDLKAKIDTEKRGMTPDEVKAVTDTDAELEALEPQIAAEEKLEKRAKEAARNAAPIVHNANPNNAEEKAAQRFSLIEFLNGAEKRNIGGFYKEMHQEAEREMKNAEVTKYNERQGYGIPTMILENLDKKFVRAGQSAGTNSEGGYMIQTDVQPLVGTFKPNPVIAQVGASMHMGSVGNLSFPIDTALFTMQWLAENGASVETDKVISQLILTPQRLAGYSLLSRRWLQQTSPSNEAYIASELMAAINYQMDKGALTGRGHTTYNEPAGLFGALGVAQTVYAGNTIPTFAKMVSMETKIATNDAEASGMCYLTTPGVRGGLKTKLKDSVGTTGHVWESDNTVNGYKAFVSSAVPSTLNAGANHGVFFGNFKDMHVAQWGGIFVAVDAITALGTSQIKIFTELQADSGITRAKSFSMIPDVTTASS